MIKRKAAGPDGLNSELFKYGGHVRLLKLINKCWTERVIPEEWGQARVKSLAILMCVGPCIIVITEE